MVDVKGCEGKIYVCVMIIFDKIFQNDSPHEIESVNI